MDYTKHFSTTKTSQKEFIPGKENQVLNSAGGVSFSANPLTMLDRFLMLGTEGGSYYATEQKLTVENAKKIVELIQTNEETARRVLDRTVEVSQKGLAHKNDPAIFTLALICTVAPQSVKEIAYRQIDKVCRTGTHLFTFVQNIKNLRKWSRGLRKGISRYYENRTPEDLAYQLMKYRQRAGWTQQDVVRLAHPKFPQGAEGIALKLFGKNPGKKPVPNNWLAFEAVQELKNPSDKKQIKTALTLIEEHGLPWEAIPTELHKSKDVWAALLPKMGLTAVLRNLSRFAKLGLTTESSLDDTTKAIVKRFRDKDEIRKSRLHPLSILNGAEAYALGYPLKDRDRDYYRYLCGQKEKQWNPSQIILAALEDAFYLAFENIEPTQKNYMLGIDVSGSMASYISGTALTCRAASVALALCTVRTEPYTFMMAFQNKFVPLKGITSKTSLQDAIRKVDELSFGPTDCAQPMLWATKTKTPVDVFCVYTDSETWYGKVHPTQALEEYRQKMGRNAKLIVLGMMSNGFTIADPTDPGQLDIVGFSVDTPKAITTFVNNL